MSEIFPYEEYSDFSKRLERTHTKDFLGKEYSKLFSNKIEYKSRSNLNDRSYLYSQARAHKFNSMTGNYEQRCHYRWALEIYSLYPEKTYEAKNND
jgi:hypothetical protein